MTTVPRLRALIVPSSDAEARFIMDVLEDHGDTPVLVKNAQEALSELALRACASLTSGRSPL